LTLEGAVNAIFGLSIAISY